MKDDTVTRMYAGLNDRERAMLAFDYLMQGDMVEIGRITSSMPLQHFVGISLEYRRHSHGLQIVASLYSIEYWRNVALANIYLVGLNAMSHKTVAATKHMTDEEIVHSAEWQAWEELLERFTKHQTMLLSLEASVDELCADRGINPEAIRKLAGEQHFEIVQTPSKPDLQPDTLMVEELNRLWAEILDG